MTQRPAFPSHNYGYAQLPAPRPRAPARRPHLLVRVCALAALLILATYVVSVAPRPAGGIKASGDGHWQTKLRSP